MAGCYVSDDFLHVPHGCRQLWRRAESDVPIQRAPCMGQNRRRDESFSSHPSFTDEMWYMCQPENQNPPGTSSNFKFEFAESYVHDI
jgi:hypothetical protein